MNTLLRPTLLIALLVSSGWACAQAVVPQPPPPPAAPPPVQASSPELRVVEDDQVRIEETRVRGQLQRIVVHTRLGGARSYEIIVGSPGRDPSQERGAAGQRTWSVLSF